MFKSFSRRTLALLFALLVMAFSLSIPEASQAQYPAGSYVDWFSDGTMTNQVGGRYTNCQGQVVTFWGYVTEYPRYWRVSCGIDTED